MSAKEQAQLETLWPIPLRLGLSRADDRHFFGTVQGFPVGLTIVPTPIDPKSKKPANGRPANTLLFQVRHVLEGNDIPGESMWQFGPAITDLLKIGKASVSMGDRIAWLDIYDDGTIANPEAVAGLVESYLGAMSAAGVANDPTICHYCGAGSVTAPRFADERVAQICDSCMASRVQATAEHNAVRSGSLVAAVIAGAGGAVIGGAMWGGLWIGWEYFLDWMADPVSGKAQVPMKIALVVMCLLAAGLVGVPAGLPIRLAPRRGVRASRLIGAAAGLAAIVLGEVVWATWGAYLAIGAFVPIAATSALPSLWSAQDYFVDFMKIAAAIAVVATAVGVARLKKKVLEL